MGLEYQDVIIEIIKSIIILPQVDEKIDLDTDLKNIGLDSLSFVKTVVEIENHFGIEFPDERLDIFKADTVRKLCKIVMEVKDPRGEIG
ncbi:D-alanine--poly(phosphoribitol) ligase subunit 2 [Lachnospiraceae bacterium]|nr:D-alanine--poly(phosphoribitol) ligase subunit 2 [Lachnospiraceae bacterium]